MRRDALDKCVVNELDKRALVEIETTKVHATTGWGAGEEIPGTEGIFLSPVVAKDFNGDAWVMWRTRLGQTRMVLGNLGAWRDGRGVYCTSMPGIVSRA